MTTLGAPRVLLEVRPGRRRRVRGGGRRLRRAGGARFRVRRALLFAGGAAACSSSRWPSPVGLLADGYLFSAHMLQHLLLVLVVPPLALLGVAPALRAQGARQASDAALARPVVAWALGVGAMWLWHAPTLCDAASQQPAASTGCRSSRCSAWATAFWWPILAPRRGVAPAAARRRRLPLHRVRRVHAARHPHHVLAGRGVLGLRAPGRPARRDAALRDGWGLTAERDQQVGGLLMWVPACLVYGAGILGVLARLLREHPASPSRWRARR